MNSPFSLKIILLIFITGLFTKSARSQDKYWVFFSDKKDVQFNPYEYFDKKAIERRIKNGIPLNDYTDWPVSETYLDKVISLVDSATKTSRWFNALAVFASSEQIDEVKELSFVSAVEEMISYAVLSSASPEPGRWLTLSTAGEEDQIDTDLLKRQTGRMGADEFAQNNIDGTGIRIAIFDAGFPTVDVNPAFEHIRKENRIIKTYDFIKNKENVYRHSSHGTMVFSCIAGKKGDQIIGLATGAEFLLARTEMSLLEPLSEEENWLAAVEWADKNGADIINSSLAYTYHRYFTSDMDGKKSLVARAANMAASKGMLVLNAAGNDGESAWKYLGTPADADSVLTVGGISPESDYHISFSSYGPTADKRLKPNVCAFGAVVASGKKGLETIYGTSFSTPLVTGFAACAWQTNKNLNNMELFKEIEKSADLYPYFDYAHGYGVPQANHFTNKQKQIIDTTFYFDNKNGLLKVYIDEEKYVAEDIENRKMLYYHIENKMGHLDKYYVILAKKYDVLEFLLSDYAKGEKLRVHFNGFTNTYQF